MDITAKDRRALIVFGAVAAVALLLFVFVLHKSKGSSSPSNPAAVSGSQPSTEPSVPPSPSPATSPSPHHEGHTGSAVPTVARDPFKVLVSDSPAPNASPSPSPAPPPASAPSPSA